MDGPSECQWKCHLHSAVSHLRKQKLKIKYSGRKLPHTFGKKENYSWGEYEGRASLPINELPAFIKLSSLLTLLKFPKFIQLKNSLKHGQLKNIIQLK